MNDSDFAGPNPNTPTPQSSSALVNDDYDIYSYDEGDDFFQDHTNPNQLDAQRVNATTSLEPISTNAIRLLQHSISRIKNSASSTGLFGTNDDKNTPEAKGFEKSTYVNVLFSIGLLSESRASRRGMTQSASQIAIAAAQADKLSKSNTNPRSANAASESNRLSLQIDAVDQLEKQSKGSTETTGVNKNNLLSPSVSTVNSPRRAGTRKQPLPQIQRIMSASLQAALSPSQVPGTNTESPNVTTPPPLSRGMSARATVEASRQALMEMMSQIR